MERKPFLPLIRLSFMLLILRLVILHLMVLTTKSGTTCFAKLVGIICRRVENTCAGSIDIKHFNIANAKYLLAEQYGYPYPSAARTCMGGVEEWAHNHSVDQKDVLFYFEDGAKHKGQIEWIAERDGLTIPAFRKKSEVIALQAGDLLAWLIHLSLATRIRDCFM